MTRPVITVRPEMTIQQALKRMHTEHIRRAPLVDGRARLIGMVSEGDRLYASPSEATSPAS